MDDRPKRRAIPVAVKRAVCARQNGVCKCGCGMVVSEKPKTGTKFDHRPPLRLRDLSQDGDYTPHQHSADHIDALCRESHDRRTFGTGATTAGTDTGLIKKERKRGKPPKPSRKWGAGQKLKGRGFQKVYKPMRPKP